MPFEDLERYYELLDRAWEAELALFFSELATDLENGYITVEQAKERIRQICPSDSI
jgi:hypothetical protein